MTTTRERKEVTGRTVQRERPATARPAAAPRADTRPLRRIDAPAAWLLTVVDADAPSDAVAALLASACQLAAGRDDCAVVALTDRPAHAVAPHGADRVVVPPPGDDLQPCADAVVALVQALRPLHTLFVSTPAADDLARRVAAAIGSAVALGVVDLRDGVAVRRSRSAAWQLRGEVPPVLTVDTTSIDVAPPAARGEAIALALPAFCTATPRAPAIHAVAARHLAANELPLAVAPLVVAGGAGVGDWDALRALAARLGAAVAGSRVVCDAGTLPRDRQVGASGTLLGARCYVAAGISGAVQHLAGIERCTHVIAINRDAGAPILGRANLGIVGDADTILRCAADLLAAEEGR
jgi:electron transfer flavoprotein alpha subunit